ncbi:MAG: hypothetical protein NC397_09715 [Clostridium sp.]|nr:hypothetical protein [Clostridium sp.]
MDYLRQFYIEKRLGTSKFQACGRGIRTCILRMQNLGVRNAMALLG